MPTSWAARLEIEMASSTVGDYGGRIEERLIH